ncbi:MAG TPA: ATP-binding protein [Acidimicrobiia bacterium]|nr:ATP-binding protein [Acidimicrobiia bacterium]
MRVRRPDRPLDKLPTLKLKLSVVILAAVAVTVIVFYIGVHARIWPSIAGVIAGGVALGVVWFISRGMTSPLREMVGATEAMARGDFSRRVPVTSHDEIGTLAVAFNQMASELAETDRLRRDLVANVSHELRTPIAALQAVLENLVDGVAPPEPETLRTMLAQVERLGRLVQQLLDLSRLESGVLALDRRPFDVEPMLEHALRESRMHTTVRLEVELDPRPFRLQADSERLHQVITNLVENAVRHSPLTATVVVRAIAQGSGGARFEVIDEGPGIPDDEMARVFERFYRSDAARASRDGGAGLGLAIARWIVELHGGEIHVEHNRPHGCRMVVTIPGRIELSSPQLLSEGR